TFYKMGLTRDGKIQAAEIRMICDGGAYGLSTEGVMRKAAILGAGPYNIPNLKMDTYGVYTNNTPSGAFRSFGALQSQFATESHLDVCAERLGIDPFELRRVNAMRDGALTHTRQKLRSVSLLAVLKAAEEASGWQAGAPVARGAARADFAKDGVRPPCTLGTRFAAPAAKSEVASWRAGAEADWRRAGTGSPAPRRSIAPARGPSSTTAAPPRSSRA